MLIFTQGCNWGGGGGGGSWGLYLCLFTTLFLQVMGISESHRFHIRILIILNYNNCHRDYIIPIPYCTEGYYVPLPPTNPSCTRVTSQKATKFLENKDTCNNEPTWDYPSYDPQVSNCEKYIIFLLLLHCTSKERKFD